LELVAEKMRIATWNINSVRLRTPLLERLVREKNIDVLCLQETKVIDADFPTDALQKIGFRHQHYKGMKSYNGVAILSRLPFAKTGSQSWCGKEDCRHISVQFQNGLEVHNFYVPAGGDIPDASANPKFAHKLSFCEEAAAFSKKQHGAPQRLLVGDLNIAPHEQDVWSHRQLMDVVSHTPIEIEKLVAWKKAGQWIDIAREFHGMDEKLYSWWSYRAGDWEKSNRGRRLDHIWSSPDLMPHLSHFTLLREARGWGDKPSDHVPVIVDVG
jgi:exodeoxyribonuclease III